MEPMKSRGHWRASIREEAGWRPVRSANGPYEAGPLVEWGSITKGLVGTAAAMTLPLDREVRQLAPRFPGADFTVRDLVEHTSGLPRLHVGMGLVPLRDPYLPTVGAPLDPEKVVRIGARGHFAYSNLGYALLGALLDEVDGDWFLTVRKLILEPAGIATATTAPRETARVVPRRVGRPIRPWTMTGSPYAAAGGIWSTFEDLCRYADWALGDRDDPARTVAWQRREATTWINGQVRAAGAVIVSAGGVTAVVHALKQRLFTPDRIATAIIERELSVRGRRLRRDQPRQPGMTDPN